jgi:hypothetical protein
MAMRKLWIALIALFGAIIAFWHLLVRRRETVDWRDVSKVGRLVDVNGETIHYIDEGKGPAVVLIHGLGGHTYSYRTLVPDLARDHRVVPRPPRLRLQQRVETQTTRTPRRRVASSG